jgi:ABC-type sugar transport system ATPase subunit
MMILTAVKMKFVDQAIEKLPTGNQESIIIKRNAAMRFEETGKIDHEGKHTIYAQIWR